jgi:hypothetical protein
MDFIFDVSTIGRQADAWISDYRWKKRYNVCLISSSGLGSAITAVAIAQLKIDRACVTC